MEGTKSSLNRTTIAIIIIVLFHIVGLIGFFITAAQPLFLHIVPFHLLLMLLVIFYSYGKVDIKLLAFILLVYITGFASEWIGVHKNWIFGEYTYGNTLGLKLDGIPLTMGINWFLLIYATGVLMQKSRIRFMLVRVIAGALLLVLLDVLIEPVAQRFDYWHWTTGGVPFTNYMGWFGISLLSLFFFELFDFKRQSWAAPVLLLVQFMFFGILQLV